MTWWRGPWGQPTPPLPPTRATILTGRAARGTGVGRTVESERGGTQDLPLSEVIQPEVQSPAGCATSAVGK